MVFSVYWKLPPVKIHCTNSKQFDMDLIIGMSVFKQTLQSGVNSLKWQENLLAIGCGNGVLSLWDMLKVRILLEIQAHSGKY